MVQHHTALAVDQNQSWRCTGPIVGEVGFADGHRDALESGVVVLPNLPNVGDLVLGLRIFSFGGVSVELGGSQNRQSLRSEFRTQPGDDRPLVLAVYAPVSPEKQKNRRTFELAQRSRPGAEILRST